MRVCEKKVYQPPDDKTTVLQDAAKKALFYFGLTWNICVWRQWDRTHDALVLPYCIVVGSRRIMPPDALQPKAYCTNPGL